MKDTTDPETLSAIKFAELEGYITIVEGRPVIQWRFTERDRALLQLMGVKLTNLRGSIIDIPLGRKITYNASPQVSR